jgi:autotransporter-associated beta strand protein
MNLTGGLRVSGGSTGNGTVHLDGGTIYTPFVEDGGGTATFHFNGGTLKVRNSTTTFMQGLDTVDVLSGGAVIDTNGFNITIAQALLAGSSSGGLTKNGSGILTLTGNPTYTGEMLLTPEDCN